MSSADAVARETAWLAGYDAGDGLPGLLKAYGGPFDVVQAYVPRTGAQRQARLYVTRSQLRVERFGFNRKINHHTFMLRLYWPQSSPTGQAESVQQDFDTAVDLVVQRISGLFMDKTHGARFLSVAENPNDIDVQFGDPEASIQAKAELTALITYQADDQDYTS
ncbi:hypothetical protein STRTUCAR8_08550 [Streptomyces turgidiscabies Car8]|uniref:Uncharacterized protein n=1 Tax=Streptomyces turgidiscabies (strain Car8) TaxID=698760 RepID=L7F988_STRT8|nr:hypothetical protein [Streptomyces turgidiscabies]ELP67679.1 hypothetical protein STRTUCAR8_08550 [Streptomyces turgidiscabies Car8]